MGIESSTLSEDQKKMQTWIDRGVSIPQFMFNCSLESIPKGVIKGFLSSQVDKANEETQFIYTMQTTQSRKEFDSISAERKIELFRNCFNLKMTPER